VRYASVCAGIEAASVAWGALGWEAAWFSEIEPFPRAVLARHYPGVPCLGDFTAIRPRWLRRVGLADTVDVLIGGTPCQSFSVAGQRAGLDDARGHLAIEFFKLARRLRARWVVWENVPGVHSSWSDDAEVTTADTPDGWGDFEQSADFTSLLDIVAQCGYSCAWRILDAQYFGVPQRRRRVFLVGYFGDDWRPPVAVLFERDSLRGDFTPGGAAGEDVAGSLTHGAGGGRYDKQPMTSYALNSRQTRQDGTVETLISAPLTGSPYADNEAQESRLICHTLRAEGFDASEDGTGRGCPIVPIAFECKSTEVIADNDLSPTLRSMSHREGHANGGGQVAVCFESRFSRNGRGAPSEIVPPLKAQSGESGKGDGAPLIAGAITKSLGEGGYAPDKINNYIPQIMSVRRLTPRECERLQGFPDDYTLIRYRGKPAADGPRYRALGNSMAVPVIRWLGARIGEVDTILRELEHNP